MATKGLGKCPRCGAAHKSILTRGPCRECVDKDLSQRKVDRVATPEKLRENPYMAELEDYLDEHYPT